MPIQSPNRVSLQGPAGTLEALVEYPDNDPIGAAVICHPHPLHGGTLENKVTYTLARVHNDLGMVSIRFNFRGVGGSEGSHDDGEGERDDVLAITDWAHSEFGLPLSLAGFSFGGCMAIRAASEADARQLVLVAPAVERYGVDAHDVALPVTVAQGMQDDVVDPGATLEWAERQPGPVNVLAFDDAGHYFHRAQVHLRRRLIASLAGKEEE
jgi:alpha/beta superfamily hydrolase